MALAGTFGKREVPPLAAPPRHVPNLVADETGPWIRRPAGIAHRALAMSMWLSATLLAVIALSALAVAAIGPRLGLYRMETVLSGSMQPTFNPGDLIIVTPEPVSQVHVGQIISYQIPIGDHHVESHRVTRVERHGNQTIIESRGDSNAAADPWRAQLTSHTAWRERLVIPTLGWLIIWMRQPLAQHLSVIVIPFLLAAWWLLRIWRPRPTPTAP